MSVIDLSDIDPELSSETKKTIQHLRHCSSLGKNNWIKYAHPSNNEYLDYLCTSKKEPVTPSMSYNFLDFCNTRISNHNKYIGDLCKKYFPRYKEMLIPSMPYTIKDPVKVGVYGWKSNSCWYDSLMVIILMSKCRYHINTILNTDVLRTNYKRLRSINFINKDCGDVNNLAKMAHDYRLNLLEEYNNLINGGHLTQLCGKSRGIISKCLISSERGSYGSPSELYDVLCMLFPRLIQEVPVITSKKIKETMYLYTISPKSVVYPGDTIYKIRWDEYNPSAIVIDLFNWSEYNKYVLIKKKSLNLYDIEDIKTMNKDIPDKRNRTVVSSLNLSNQGYSLYGIVVYDNPGHWVSYFKPFDDPDQFYYYDGLSNIYEKTNGEDLLLSTPKRFVRMLFFERVNNKK